ncbi:MAG: PhnD/SsuA/transferrin family substrate-binding protein [Bosea sp. (in: a-proteobacteria)]
MSHIRRSSDIRAGGIEPKRALNRRQVLSAVAAAAVALPAVVRAEQPFTFGLTPVFLTSDLALLDALQAYLSEAMDRDVRLVLKRTYQEITSQLATGQIDAAWICGFPYVAYQSRLQLVAVPTWRGHNTYQSYLITAAGRASSGIDDIRGDAHAFSDPDSNSGFLVTRALLAERNVRPDSFFRKSFFTYGHRNVVRAVASGLAQSGSVDGYVWEVLTETEPELTRRTRVIWRSEWMGFPPIATSNLNMGRASITRLQRALYDMADNPVGRRVLELLRLDGFSRADPSMFDSIALRVDLVRRAG